MYIGILCKLCPLVSVCLINNACGYNLYDVAVALYRDLASQGLKGYITDEISHLKDLVSL
jgi:hypothetical protein